MAERQPIPNLKNDFRETDQGFHFDLDRKMGAILDDMAVGYAAALGHERNMSPILEPRLESHS